MNIVEALEKLGREVGVDYRASLSVDVLALTEEELIKNTSAYQNYCTREQQFAALKPKVKITLARTYGGCEIFEAHSIEEVFKKAQAYAKELKADRKRAEARKLAASINRESVALMELMA